MSQLKKVFTTNGKPVARFTMLVEWKPEFILPNKDTGEMKSRWTYRNDHEAEKLEAATGLKFMHPIDVLGFIFNKDRHKYLECRIFDNSKPTYREQLKVWERNGELQLPCEKDEIEKFNNWLKRCV